MTTQEEYQNLLNQHQANQKDLQLINNLYENQINYGLPDQTAQENVLKASRIADAYHKNNVKQTWAECFSNLASLIINVR